MSYKGTVRNGVVVLDAPLKLPEGTTVHVEPVSDQKASASRPEDPLFDMSQYAVDTGIPDLAVNLDHYLYGHPKVKHGE